MRPTRLSAALAVAASLALPAVAGLGTSAHAADPVSITHVQPTPDGEVRLLVAVPPGAEVDLGSVTVQIDGQDATATAEAAGGADVERTTVLAFDTSKSMRGERFDAAQAAADAFLSNVPADVEVGIVTFDRDVVEALPPTTDRDAARTVVGGLELARQTRLYDGVIAATALAGKSGQRSILVLSDGADTSKTPLTDVIGAVSRAGVLLDVVALEQAGDLSELSQLSAAGNGKVINAEAEALSAAFSEEAQALGRQVVVTAQVPEGVSGEQTDVEVAMTAGGETLTASAFAPIREVVERASAPVVLPSASEPPMLPEWGKWAAVALIGLGLALFLGTVLPGLAKKEMTAEERVALYTAGAATGAPIASSGRSSGEETLAHAKSAAQAVLSRNKSMEERIEARLEAAGSGWRAAEWLLLHTGFVVGAGVLGILVGGGNIFVGILFIVAGVVLPRLYLGFKRRRRVKKFNALLPDTLQLMSGSLAAGLSLAQSVDTIVREGSEPIAGEFRRVLVETRLGVTLEDAMEGITERFDSKDFAWIVMAIKIQRQVGGNLAELLDTVAGTIREREYMRRQVQALAAEGKVSAYVLGALPPGFLVYLLLTKPDYVGVMFTDPLGWLMLGGSVLMLSVGAFWMSRLIKVEV